jgi:acetyltransferase
VESRICHDENEALSAAAAAGRAVVVKTAEPSIEHRADVGGVRVGLATRHEVADAYRDLSRLGTAVLVQPQLTGIEMVVGGLRDPAFGPVVMTGLGGTVVELLEDVTFALAPVTIEEAVGMIERLQGFPLLCGYRGAPRASIEALADAITAVGRLMATCPDIAEIDLNPVMVTESEAVAVDWKVYVGG